MDIHKIKTKKKEDWIQKDIESKIAKLDKKSLFVPSQKELFF